MLTIKRFDKNIHWLLLGLSFQWFMPSEARGQVESFAQKDALQTLQWVERQSGRIDSLLHDAMRSSEPIEILIRLTECYQVFDAVAMAGLYCTEVRAAAEAGRRQCDVINYRLEKDLNAKLQRAVEARRQALRMLEASKSCQTANAGQPSVSVFTPLDILAQDVEMASLDLADGLATQDLHILSQKLEHAIRLLYDAKHLAQSLQQCEQQSNLSESAILHCQAALGAPNWLEAQRSVRAALDDLTRLRTFSGCY